MSKIDLERYAEVLATIRYFGPARRPEVLARLGVRPAEWTAAASEWAGVRDNERLAGETLVTARFGATMAATRARLTREKPAIEELGPLGAAVPAADADVVPASRPEGAPSEEPLTTSGEPPPTPVAAPSFVLAERARGHLPELAWQEYAEVMAWLEAYPNARDWVLSRFQLAPEGLVPLCAPFEQALRADANLAASFRAHVAARRSSLLAAALPAAPDHREPAGVSASREPRPEPPRPSAAFDLPGATAFGVMLPIPGRELPFGRTLVAAPPEPSRPVVSTPSGGTAFDAVMPIPGRELPFGQTVTVRKPEPAALAAPAPSGGTAFGVVMPLPGRELPFQMRAAPGLAGFDAEQTGPLGPPHAPVLPFGATPGSVPDREEADREEAWAKVGPALEPTLELERSAGGAQPAAEAPAGWVEAPPSEGLSAAVTSEVQRYAQLVWDLERAPPEGRPPVFASFGLDSVRFAEVKRRLDAEIAKHSLYRTFYDAAYGAAGESLRMGLRR